MELQELRNEALAFLNKSEKNKRRGDAFFIYPETLTESERDKLFEKANTKKSFGEYEYWVDLIRYTDDTEMYVITISNAPYVAKQALIELSEDSIQKVVKIHSKMQESLGQEPKFTREQAIGWAIGWIEHVAEIHQ